MEMLNIVKYWKVVIYDELVGNILPHIQLDGLQSTLTLLNHRIP